MNTIKVVGIDIAKSVFQVCVWMADGSVALNRKIPRQKLLHTVRQFPPHTLIAMEAYSTSHFWGADTDICVNSYSVTTCWITTTGGAHHVAYPRYAG